MCVNTNSEIGEFGGRDLAAFPNDCLIASISRRKDM